MLRPQRCVQSLRTELAYIGLSNSVLLYIVPNSNATFREAGEASYGLAIYIDSLRAFFWWLFSLR